MSASASQMNTVQPPQIIGSYPDSAAKILNYQAQKLQQRQREQQELHRFTQDWQIQPENTDTFGHNCINAISDALIFWCKNSSNRCNSCNVIIYNKLMPTFMNRTQWKNKQPCHCTTERYIVPRITDIPPALKNLTKADILALRPFDLDCGLYDRHPTGYRLKKGMIKLVLSPVSVEEKIQSIDDDDARSRCINAYQFLMNSADSQYSYYVSLRNRLFQENKSLNAFNMNETVGLECALWPNMYPRTDWCESAISGSDSRLSSKMSFILKVFSEIADYALHFDLLQFQYDRCIYKTVSGAINSARFLNCSPARALDTKQFSPTFWQWQHLYLLDAVQQFGLPDVFITISPFEWSFPFPNWLDQLRSETGLAPTQLAAFETYHIAHTLEQIVRGYLCGSNDKRWSNHVFSYNRIAKHANVRTYFYRFEFQNRGTLHIHLLIWLKDITKTQHQLIRADIPRTNPHLAFLAYKLQKSDKHSPNLNLQNAESFFEMRDGKNVQHLKHPAAEFALNLRAYISTLLPTLKCSMDYQTTDGVGMLLRYVSSYVTKFRDDTPIDSLYSYNLQGRQAAIRYLISNQPAEPEMWFFLCSKKVAWSCSRTKRYSVPTTETFLQDKTLQKYWRRPEKFEQLTLLDWLRQVDNGKVDPKPYKDGSTLVATKMHSIFNQQYFFQYTILHMCHRNIAQTYHPNHDNIPKQLQCFGQALHNFPDFWSDKERLSSFFTVQGHKATYVQTIISYIQGLSDLFYLTQMQLLNPVHLLCTSLTAEDNSTLDPYQFAIVRHVKNAVFHRRLHYHIDDDSLHEDCSDSDSEHIFQNNYLQTNAHCSTHYEIEWQRPTLITGNPGTGKSHTILGCVSELLKEDVNILIAMPTGFLASCYRSQTQDEVSCETVHSSFTIPVSPTESPKINWSLSRFDLIIIDELSMISETIFQHVLMTVSKLLFRPVFVLSGDGAQQQPFTREATRIIPVTNPLNNSQFVSSTYHFHLTEQHRVEDQAYLNFLNHIRHWVPTQNELDDIQRDRVICPDNIFNADKIMQMFLAHADISVLTFTNNAADEINKLVLANLFNAETSLATVKFDNGERGIDTEICCGMRVVITQNRDKENNVINGQMAKIYTMHNSSIILQLSSTRKLVTVYPVTMKRHTYVVTLYPLRLAYANTMCKAQGQTLPKAALWFDIENIPPGSAYVALSRVKKLADIFFITPLKPAFFRPVTF